MMSNIPSQFRPPKATLVPMVPVRSRRWQQDFIVHPYSHSASIVSDDGTRVLTSDDGKYYLTYASTGAL